MRRRPIAIVIVAAGLVLGAGALAVYGRGMWHPLLLRIAGPRAAALASFPIALASGSAIDVRGMQKTKVGFT